ncbi:probable E3 ubiquitin-protein ligase ARI8 [Coffea eugenioides]|uniref:probable E3 ubiquitin-protein ligase ARI8 n=1 Tax=Coffea eugenioides TaxID=49369 RepID=UPI000F60A91D|nr:probable E3 ubiquitin-protein ligase ARI8 [Coffea eugenioides]
MAECENDYYDSYYSERLDHDHANKKKNKFIILTEEDVGSRMDDDILQVSSVLSVSREAATILLYRYNWDVTDVVQEWFENQEGVRSASGLFREKPGPMDVEDGDEEFVCRICWKEHPIALVVVASAACGHVFCKNCWKEFISKSINEGYVKDGGCLMLRCPQDSCGAAVGGNIIRSLASDGDKNKYDKFLARSYVESRANLKLCPTPGCNCAVELDNRGPDRLSKNFDVSCNCMYGFCWNCLGEAHSPVDCETVALWAVKNSSDLETKNWLLANTKPCPKCQRRIENVGDIDNGDWYMTCAPPCGCDLRNGEETLACNTYEKAKNEGVYDEVEKTRRRAKASWDYFERWYNNHLSLERAFLDLHLMKNQNLEMLSKIHGLEATQFWFIVDAWVQIVECTRVLKWASVYGYYLQQYEHKKKELFDYLLSKAEGVYEILHQCANKGLSKCLEAECSLDTFLDFRTKLPALTRVTRKYFADLVTALENGIAELASSSHTIKQK